VGPFDFEITMCNFGKGSRGGDSLEQQLLNVQALNLINLSLGNAIDTETPARLKKQLDASKGGDWFTASLAKRDKEGTFLPVVPSASYDFTSPKGSSQIPVGMLNSAALTPTYKAPGVPDFDEMKRQSVAAAMKRVDQAVALQPLDRQRVKDAVVRSVRFGDIDPKVLNRIVGYAQGGSAKIARLAGAGAYGVNVDHHSLASLMLELDGKFNSDKGYWQNRSAVKNALIGRLNAAGMSSDETYRLAMKALGRTDELARIDALQARERYNAAHQAELDSTNPNRVGGPKQSWDFATDYGRVVPRQQDSEANRRVMSNGVYMALDGPIDQMGQWMDVSGFAASMANAGVDLKDIKAFHHQLGTLGFSLMGAGTGEVSQAANIFLTANQRARNVAVLSDRYATREQKNSALQELAFDAFQLLKSKTKVGLRNNYSKLGAKENVDNLGDQEGKFIWRNRGDSAGNKYASAGEFHEAVIKEGLVKGNHIVGQVTESSAKEIEKMTGIDVDLNGAQVRLEASKSKHVFNRHGAETGGQVSVKAGDLDFAADVVNNHDAVIFLTKLDKETGKMVPDLTRDYKQKLKFFKGYATGPTTGEVVMVTAIIEKTKNRAKPVLRIESFLRHKYKKG